MLLVCHWRSIFSSIRQKLFDERGKATKHIVVNLFNSCVKKKLAFRYSTLTSKLAGDRLLRELLFPQHEIHDSGIDSDNNEPPRQRIDEPRLHSAESSSSDDEMVVKAPWVRAVKKKNEELLNAMATEQFPPRNVAANEWQLEDISFPLDRMSPPLLEVELTASEEDDDASVLELVIPLQTARYQRVPTSSPKKTNKVKTRKFICKMFCCL